MDHESFDLRNSSFQSATSTNASASSSKAVLAALRALQDKIRRLEAERTQAMDETAQLRHQLKNQEVETEHLKQKESLVAQRSLHEARNAYDRLLTEKTELEMRVAKMEDRNQDVRHQSESFQERIRLLEDEKHRGQLKIKDLESQQLQHEMQISTAQRKEQGIFPFLQQEAISTFPSQIWLSLLLVKVGVMKKKWSC